MHSETDRGGDRSGEKILTREERTRRGKSAAAMETVQAVGITAEMLNTFIMPYKGADWVDNCTW